MKKLVRAVLWCIVCLFAYTAKADPMVDLGMVRTENSQPANTDVKIIEAGAAISLICTTPQDPLPAVIEMWQADMELVFGTKPEVISGAKFSEKVVYRKLRTTPSIILGISGDGFTEEYLSKNGVKTTSLSGKWEYYRMQMIEVKGCRHLLILGSDARGAAYGLLELSRLAGVSPWIWWADVHPQKKEALTLPIDFCKEEGPSVKFRGIFINDEDYAFMPWASQTLDKEAKLGELGPEAYSRVFQLLLRLKANLLWPAMHDCSTAFYAVKGNLEAAKRYGIYIGTSHCEPLMRNNVAEWKSSEYGDYDYSQNAARVRAYWQERLEEVKGTPCVYTLGMRGIHDGKMQGAKTLAQQTSLLQRVIDDQREMLSSTLGDSIQGIPQVFIPYKEVLDIYKNGLQVPDDITLIWCDDNYGYIRRLSSPEEQLRSGGSGVYYHVSYWGRPHDYLWLSSTSPALVHTEMTRAWNYGTQQLWVLNVGDIKPSEYLTEYFLELAWNIHLTDHQQQFYTREFGPTLSSSIVEIMKQYYRLAYQRKPEFTAWTKVEESKARYARGWTPVANSLWSEAEILERLDQYQALEWSARCIGLQLDSLRRDAFYQLVYYPVAGASLINQKNFYAELSRRNIEQGNDSMALIYGNKAWEAYANIQQITHYYNHEMSHGKWNRMMNSAPRKLYVFDSPVLPTWIDSTLNSNGCKETKLSSFGFLEGEMTSCEKQPLQKNLQLSAASALSIEGVRLIPELGYSGSLVVLNKDQSLEYEFEITEIAKEEMLKDNTMEASKELPSDSVTLVVYTAPNHAANGGNLRYSVAVDGATPLVHDYRVEGRSETWKQQVLSNQSAFRFKQKLCSGTHRLKITAMDDDIRLDRIVVETSTK